MKVISKAFDSLTPRELYSILKAREQVFLLEQNIVCMDMDDIDLDSTHCYIGTPEGVAAYLRIYKLDSGTAKIGRVLTLERKKGLGRLIMDHAISLARDLYGCQKICVSAQVQAIGFYKKTGFSIVSDVYLEEGVEHVLMELEL